MFLKVIVRVQVGFNGRVRGIVEAIHDSQRDSIKCRYGTASNSLSNKYSKCNCIRISRADSYISAMHHRNRSSSKNTNTNGTESYTIQLKMRNNTPYSPCTMT